MIDIYTDGSCLGNPGPGGWGALLVEETSSWEMGGGHPRTTNNRMEITAAIEGLKETPKNSSVTIHSDSEYLVKTMTRNWRRRKNLDLWEELDSLEAERRVRWRWIKGHAGHPGNELVDSIAVQQAEKVARGDMSIDASSVSRRSFSRKRLAGVQDAPRQELTHLDSQGRAQMVDVGDKAVTKREAVARGFVSMKPETLALITGGKVDKGDVFATARLAGIMAAKQTSQLIPLCHPLPISRVTVELSPDADQGGVSIEASVRTEGKTGVEMEALTAVSVAALTVYDMCKAVDRGMRIQSVRLAKKTGGQSGDIVLEK